jgi:hypothetical protein
MPQVQGYMEILDVEYCDLMSYTTKVHPPQRQARVLHVRAVRATLFLTAFWFDRFLPRGA